MIYILVFLAGGLMGVLTVALCAAAGDKHDDNDVPHQRG